MWDKTALTPQCIYLVKALPTDHRGEKNQDPVFREPESKGTRIRQKDQLLHSNLFTYLETHLTHCLSCLFAKLNFACCLEQNGLEKELTPRVIARNNLRTAMCVFPTLWF